MKHVLHTLSNLYYNQVSAKPTSGDGPYYINSTIDCVKYLVSQIKGVRGRNISTDRLYTSIERANWLFDQHITTVGAVQKGRQGIPDELFDTTNREIFIKTCHFEKDKKDLCLSCQQHVHYIVVQKMI